MHRETILKTLSYSALRIILNLRTRDRQVQKLHIVSF